MKAQQLLKRASLAAETRSLSRELTRAGLLGEEVMIQEVVREWFKANEYAGLVLPDGWYGRPFDNMHRLCSVSEVEDTVEISFDEGGLGLRFTGLAGVKTHGRDLVLGPFKQVVFSSSESRSQQICRTGQVEFKCLSFPGDR